uniref:Uncharacterized protein n=1 Tax=Plectus sambesii TaxID=2011161 RepID=A0A914XAS2_9BILA
MATGNDVSGRRRRQPGGNCCPALVATSARWSSADPTVVRAASACTKRVGAFIHPVPPSHPPFSRPRAARRNGRPAAAAAARFSARPPSLSRVPRAFPARPAFHFLYLSFPSPPFLSALLSLSFYPSSHRPSNL